MGKLQYLSAVFGEKNPRGCLSWDTVKKAQATFLFLQAIGKTAISAMLFMVREPVFGVGFALLLPLLFGPDGVLYSLPVPDILTAAISVVVITGTYRQLNEAPCRVS